ncbi:hypothetical protein [Phenylobacterium sp.]|uniref:YncE family protein n=1 Tax=Phenylobacterium sp. TaxID=1871053 RepID=UPI0026077337|nr:hypothetical protein [Phenylobacterium sp.]
MRGVVIGVAAVLFAAVAQGAAGQAAGYRVLDRIAGPDGGWDYVRVDPAVDRVFVTRGSSVMALDLKTNKLIEGLAPGAREHVALPVEGGREILVTNGGDNTAVFADARSGQALGAVPVGKGPDAATFDARSGLVLVMDHAGGEVTLVDPKTRKAAGSITIGGTLEEASVDGKGLGFVNIESSAEVAVIDIAGRKLVRKIPLTGCQGPTGSAYDAQDKLLIVACQGVTAFVDPGKGEVVQTLPTGQGADGVVYDPARHLAFTPAGRDGTLSVIAIEKGKGRIIQTVPTQKGARTLAVDERTGRIYLPSAEYTVANGRFATVPGTFHMLVVGR